MATSKHLQAIAARASDVQMGLKPAEKPARPLVSWAAREASEKTLGEAMDLFQKRGKDGKTLQGH